MRGYYIFREQALNAITGDEDIQCQHCGTREDLAIHHVNHEDGYESGLGGWQHILAIREDIQNAVPLKVLCRSCHQEIHELHTWGVPRGLKP